MDDANRIRVRHGACAVPSIGLCDWGHVQRVGPAVWRDERSEPGAARSPQARRQNDLSGNTMRVPRRSRSRRSWTNSERTAAEGFLDVDAAQLGVGHERPPRIMLGIDCRHPHPPSASGQVRKFSGKIAPPSSGPQTCRVAGPVHRAAATDVESRTRMARGSACNGWLCLFLQFR